MTKITNELLEDYAMLYPRIDCVMMKRYTGGLITPITYIKYSFEEIEYIQLRSIESVTEEELKYLGYTNIEELKVFKDCFMQVEVDYLRSIGISTIFKEITVDELIESGKLKLI